jgi:hypothetical protein
MDTQWCLLIAGRYEDPIWSYGLALLYHGYNSTAEFGFHGANDSKSLTYIDSKKKGLSVPGLFMEIFQFGWR